MHYLALVIEISVLNTVKYLSLGHCHYYDGCYNYGNVRVLKFKLTKVLEKPCFVEDFCYLLCVWSTGYSVV
jgi:hypothetical protein